MTDHRGSPSPQVRPRSFSSFVPARRRGLPGALLAIALIAASTLPAARGQETFAQAKPEDLGFRLPQGQPKPGGGRRVVLREGGKTLVGKVYLEVEDTLVVLLPDGRLTSTPTRDATITDRPFEPATKEEMVAQLKAKFPGFKTRTTRRYIFVYNTSEAFFKATSRILETMYPPLFAYVKRQKIEVHDPETPMVAVMFKTQEAFNKYRTMPDGVAAYYNTVTNRVIMYEQSQLAELAPELAVKQSISTIAHEGVHQILHNIGVQKRLSRWPMWISEGLPEYFAPTETGRRVRWKGVGLPNDLRMHTLVEHIKATGNGPRSLSLRDTVSARQLDALGYARSWALVHYLTKMHKKEFFDYLRAVSKLEPLEPPPPAGKLFGEFFNSNFDEHEEGLYKHLKKVKYVDPIASQTHYVAMLQNAVLRTVIITPSPAAVKQWRREKNGQGRFGVKAFGNKALAERFAKAWLNAG